MDSRVPWSGPVEHKQAKKQRSSVSGVPTGPRRVIVVGGGFAGLGAASTLSSNGTTEVLVLEASEDVGGRARLGQVGLIVACAPGRKQPLRCLPVSVGTVVSDASSK